ncbi:MAG: translation initiation factor [Anaerolineales bacterium]
MPHDERPTVYSTDPEFSKRCPRCNQYPCRCPKVISLPAQEQTASIHFEKKGRGGKVVSVVRGLQLSPEDLKSLAKDLKRTCGTGGTVKAGAIEIQGDQRKKIADRLEGLGYKTKFVGG